MPVETIVPMTRQAAAGRVPNVYPRESLNADLQYAYNPRLDAGLRPGVNQQWNRADNQSWAEQLGRGLMSRGLSIGTKVVAGFGAVGGAFATPFTQDVSTIWDNPISNWANEADNKLQEIFPVFRSKDYDQKGLLGKMLTTSFWATDVMDGLAFAASAYFPGSVLGKGLSAAGKVIESGELGANFLSKLARIGATQHNAGLVLSTAYNTVAESAAEAYQTQKELETIYLQQGLPQSEAKQKAAEAAREVFGANVGILAVPNFIQNQFFHGSWGAKVKAVKDASIKSGGKATAQEFLGSRWHNVAEGIASEGLWEENVQAAVQQYERGIAQGTNDDTKPALQEIAGNMYSNMRGLIQPFLPGDSTPNEQEGALSIFLGGLLGAGFGLMGHHHDSKTYQELVKDSNDAYKSFWETVVPAADGLLKSQIASIYKTKGTRKVQQGDTEVEMPDYVLDENGKPVIDELKLHNLLHASFRDAKLWSMDLHATMNGNERMSDYNKEMALASYAYQLLSKSNYYNADDINGLLDNYAQVGDEEAKQLGIDSLVKDNLQKVKDYAKKIQELTSKHVAPKDINDPEKYGFGQFLVKTETYLAAKQNAINNLRSKTTDQKVLDSLDNLQKDTQEHMRMIKEEKSKIHKIYKEGFRGVLEMYSEAKSLNEKKTKTEEDYKRLQELTYRLQEDEYVNGNSAWNNTGARGNPIGLDTLSMTKTTPGLLDRASYELGKSYIRSNEVEQELNKPTPDLDVAVRLFNEVSVDPGTAEETASRLTGELEKSKAAAQESLDVQATVFNSLDAFSNAGDNKAEDGTPLSLFDYVNELGGDPSSVIEGLKNIGFDVDESTPVTDEFQAEVRKFADDNAASIMTEIRNASEHVEKLNSQIRQVATYTDRIDETNQKFATLSNVNNAVEFAKKQFYKEAIEERADRFIDEIRTFPERIDGLHKDKVDSLLSELRLVKAAYENRTDSDNPTDYVLKSVNKLLDTLEKEILPVIRKAIENKTKAQQQANAEQVSNLLEVLRLDNETKDLIKSILPNIDELLLGVNGTYDAVEVIIGAIRDKANAEQINKLVSKIETAKDQLLQEFYDAVDFEDAGADLKGTLSRALVKGDKWYGRMPNQYLPTLIGFLLHKQVSDPQREKHEILHRYLADLDTYQFALALSGYSALNAKERILISSILRIHSKVVALNKVAFNLQHSKLDYSKLVDIKSKLQLAPSLQQNIVLTDILNFLSSDVTNKSFGNYMLVNGIAGSGKTHLASKSVLAIWAALEEKDVVTNTYAFSANQRTSANINEAVYGSNLDRTLSNFLELDDKQLDNIDVIVIDEIYTLSLDQFRSINAKIADYNSRKETKRYPKIIALGDPSQKTSGDELPIRTTLAVNAKSTIPLTVTFRTSVDSVSMFSSSFRMRAVPVSASATANMAASDAIANPATASGVIGLNEQETIKMLNSPSSRSRVLIVTNKLQANDYKSLVPVPVLTVEQAQGLQWDEVYTLIDTDQLAGDDFAANQDLYTAYSRAKALLVVGNNNVQNTLPDPSLDQSVEQANSTLQQNAAFFDETMKAAKQTLQRLTGIPVVTAQDFVPEEHHSDEEPATDPDIAVPTSYATYDPPQVEITTLPSVNTDGVEHQLRFPTNKNLRPEVKDDNGTRRLVSKVELNSRGHIVRTTVGGGKKQTELHYLIVPSAADNSKWLVIGALGDEDYKATPQLAELASKNKGSIDSALINEEAAFTLSPEELAHSTIGTFELSSVSHFKTNQAPVYLEQEDAIESAIINFYNTFFGVDESGNRLYPAAVYNKLGVATNWDKDWVVGDKVNWNVVKDHVELRIMTNKELSEVPPDFNVIVGAPYLVISNPQQKGATKTARRFYVPFQPKPFSNNSEQFSRIRTLRDNIADVENLTGLKLGTEQMEKLVSWFANTNFHMKADATTVLKESGNISRVVEVNPTITSASEFLGKTVDPQVDSALVDIVKAVYGIDEQLVTFGSEEEALKFLKENAVENANKTWTLTSSDMSVNTGKAKTHTIQTVGALKNGRWVLKEGTDPNDPDAVKNYKEYRVTSGKGQVQRDLNNLAMANQAIGDLKIRTVTTTTASGKATRLTRAKSVFSPKESLDLEGLLREPQIIESGWLQHPKKDNVPMTTQLLDFLQNKLDSDPTEGRKKAFELVDKHTIHPFDMFTLDLIVGLDMFNEKGEHQTLRTPLRLHTFNKTGINDLGTHNKSGNYSLHKAEVRKELSSKVHTKFTGVTKTAASIKLFETTPQGPPKKVPTNVGELLSIIPKTNIQFLDHITDLLTRIQPKHIGEVFLGTPGSESYVVHSSKYKGGFGIFLNIPIDQIQKGDTTAISTLLHELIHAYTGYALSLGAEANENTKENLLYRRLTALQKRFNGAIARKGIKKSEVYAASPSKFTVHEFVANLSNPAFQKAASEIEAVSRRSKSVLREIIEAIVEFFSSFFEANDANIYNATLKAFEDFYAEDLNKAVPVTKTEAQVEDTVDSVLKEITDLVSKFSNTKSIESILRGTFETKSLPKLEFTRMLKVQSALKQLESLTKVRDSLKSKFDNIQFAYYSPPEPIMSNTGGGTKTTQNLDLVIRRFLPNASSLDEHEYNLVYSILQKQIVNPELETIVNLQHFVERNMVPQLVDEMMKVLSQEDKTRLRAQHELSTNQELAYFFNEFYYSDEMAQDFNKAVNFIISNKDQVEFIVGTIEDRAPLIHREAREYILDLIRTNKKLVDSNTDLMRTRLEMFNLIKDKVEFADIQTLEDQLIREYKVLDLQRATAGPEYTTRLFNTIPKLENELLALKALNTTNARTGNKLVYDIYKEVYPDSPFDSLDIKELHTELYELAENEVLSPDRVDEELAEATGISEYMKEFNKSYESTLSEAVKDFLTTVSIGDKYLSPSLVYIKMLQLTANLEFTAGPRTSTLQNVLNQLQRITNDSDNLISDVDSIVANALKDLIVRAQVHPFNVPDTTSIVSTMDTNGRIYYVGIFGNDASSMAFDEALRKQDIRKTKPSESATELYASMKAIDPTLSKSDFNKLMARTEAINAVKGIFNTMVSMQETNLYIAVRSSQKGYQVKFIRSKASDIAFGMKDELKSNITELHAKKEFLDAIHKFETTLKHPQGKTFTKAATTGTTEEKLWFLKKFYDNVFGLKKYKLGLSASTKKTEVLEDYIVQIKNFIAATKSLKEYGEDIPELLPVDDFVEIPDDNSFTSFIENIDGYLTRFAALAAASSDFLRNPSVRTLKGDRYYKWHEASWGSEVLQSLTDIHKDNHVVKSATGSNWDRAIPQHLYSSFYNHNIFVRGNLINKIYSVGEYEGAKNEDVDSNTPYLRENYFFFFHRKFVQGFMDGIRQFDGQRYFQYAYIPSEKPKHPLANIGLLHDSQITPAISQALTQLLEKSAWRLNTKAYNNSVENDLFRNFRVASEALRNLRNRFGDNYELSKENIPEIADEINTILNNKAKESLDKLVDDDIQIKFDNRMNKSLKLLAARKALRSVYEAQVKELKSDASFSTGRKEEYTANKASIARAVLPAYELFYKNNYINNYFLNQLIAGDYHAYDSSAGLLKRYGGVFAPGIRGLVDSTVGMKETYRTVVLDDTHVSGETNEARLRAILQPSASSEAEFQRVLSFFGDKGYDMTDAQGFMTPNRVADMGRGFERSWYRGAVHKPVHFEIQARPVLDVNGEAVLDSKGVPVTTAVPVYVKYSAIELSDTFLDAVKSPLLRRLRTNMEKLGVEELTFGSAVKTGKPLLLNEEGQSEKLTFQDFVNLDDAGIERLRNLTNTPILTLSNRHFRLQHNPASSANKNIAIYTQLMYFLNVFTNVAETGTGVHPSLKAQADRVYSLVGELIKMGREQFTAKINTPDKLFNFLRSELDGPSSERVLELIESGISINNPLIEKKAIIAIASGMESATVKVKFSGGKLVLVSAEGAHMISDIEMLPKRDLSYRLQDVNGQKTLLVDAIIPEEMLTAEQLQAVRENKPLFLYGDAIGFRIPSTELHSAVALRVVDTFRGKRSNLIIVPQDVVPIHGSDFDVDSLFVVTREKFSSTEASILTVTDLDRYQSDFRSLMDSIDEIQEGLNDEQKQELVDFKNLIREKAGILKDLKEFDGTIDDQDSVEDRYQEFISTPQYSPTARKEIIRAALDNFDDTRARHEWAKHNGLNWSVKDQIWTEQSPLVATLANLQQQIKAIEDGESQLPIGLAIHLDRLLKERKVFKKNAVEGSTPFGEADKPVAYTRQQTSSDYINPETGELEEVQEPYVFDPEFVTRVRNELQALRDYKDTIYDDLRSVLVPAVNSSIKKLESLLTKAIKNEITETMLSVISSPANKYRMTTPIAFTAIEDAIKSIPEHLRPSTNYDLSDVESEYTAYASLSSGQILTGAFANAVKVLAYLTQTGDSSQAEAITNTINEIKSNIKALQSAIRMYTDFEVVDDTDTEILEATKEENENKLATAKQLLKDAQESLKIAKDELIRVRIADNVSTRSQINSKYWFALSNEGKTEVFNKLAARTKFDNLNVTEIFDTLINSAIDNLKLGYLAQANINTSTGSFVVGATFLGVPIGVITKLLYQPIFAPIASGKSNRVDEFISSTKAAYKEQIDKLDDEPLRIEDLEDAFSNKPTDNITSNLSTQLKAFLVFEKAYNIGEDARNMASFLSIIRDMKVFVEDLDNVDGNLENKIGHVTIADDNQIILEPNPDFSFIAPNLFRNVPHIAEAYLTHRQIQNTITEQFKLHSTEIRDFADKIARGLALRVDESRNTSAANKADIRKAYATYLLSQFVWPDVSQTPNKVVSFTPKGKEPVKLVLSVTRSYMAKVANRVNMIKQFATENKIKNRFLDAIFVGSDSLDVPYISFRAGINLSPEDNKEIAIDFRKLNRFSIEGSKVTIDDRVAPYSSSSIQLDLLNYSVLAHGLSYGGSSYSMFIPAYMIRLLDQYLNEQLDSHAANETRIFEHFRASYVAQNASRLSYVNKKDIQTFGEKKRTANKEDLSIKQKDGSIDKQTIYYDLKVSNSGNSKYGEFVKMGFGKKAKVYKRVAYADGFTYYQKMGRVSDMFFSALPESIGRYRLDDYYDKSTYTLTYHNMDKNVVYSYQDIASFISKDTPFYIAPDYNLDRTERKLVKWTKVADYQTGRFPGYKYTIEEVDEVMLKVEQLENEGKITKICKIGK